MFFSVSGAKTFNSMEYTLNQSIKEYYEKRVLSFFELMYKNAKIHARDPVWRNEGTLRKNARVELYMEKEKNSMKNVYFECFSLC